MQIIRHEPIHLHLPAADSHRACVIAFRTPVSDSSGLPHILEHTTLCGSRRYPVRDPFFNMLRRSLATFMNAMTYPDLTAYPFATQSGKDFDHLLQVYLDAVFDPLLDERDFRQEGHRLEPDGDGWKRAGIVFNEMQGALGSTDAQLELALSRALLPDTMYRHEYGGDPEQIPRLTHADLVAFHRRCYTPQNAVIITYGDVDPGLIRSRLEPYLARSGTALPGPTLQPRLASGQTVDVPVPWQEGQELKDITATTVGWCWGDTANLDEVLAGDLIERLLLGHAGSPLRRALESSGLGRGLGSSGYQAHTRNGIFQTSLEGVNPADYAKVPELIDTTLAQVARDGLPDSEIEAALHQLELSRREVRGDHYPYGMELCFRCLAPWNHGSDPLPFLDPTPALAALRRTARQPGWVQQQVRERLAANSHRACLRAVPDRAFHDRLRTRVHELDRAELAEPDAAARLRAADAALKERQQAVDDPAVLPRLALSDIPAERHWATATATTGGIVRYQQPTNGILHALVALPLPQGCDPELLPVLGACLGGLGCGTRDYAAQAAHINAACAGIWAWIDIGSNISDADRHHPWMLCEAKGLAERADRFVPLVAETLLDTRFDETDRLGELIDEALAALQDRVQRSGSSLAAQAATRGFAGAASLAHRQSGLGRLAWLKAHSGDELGGLAAQLRELRDAIANQAPHRFLIGDAALSADLPWPERPVGGDAQRTRPAKAMPDTAYVTATSVNHCALAFPMPPLAHPHTAHLAVAARLLTNRWLHPRIRERGGAYGGSAGTGGGAFTLTSYRDPRLAATYQDMRDGLRWLAELPDDQLALEEAILGTIQGLDAPGSPAGEARRRAIGDLTGRTPALLDAFRARVITTTLADLRQVARDWLPPQGGTAACITDDAGARSLGWERCAI